MCCSVTETLRVKDVLCEKRCFKSCLHSHEHIRERERERAIDDRSFKMFVKWVKVLQECFQSYINNKPVHETCWQIYFSLLNIYVPWNSTCIISLKHCSLNIPTAFFVITVLILFCIFVFLANVSQWASSKQASCS